MNYPFYPGFGYGYHHHRHNFWDGYLLSRSCYPYGGYYGYGYPYGGYSGYGYGNPYYF